MIFTHQHIIHIKSRIEKNIASPHPRNGVIAFISWLSVVYGSSIIKCRL